MAALPPHHPSTPRKLEILGEKNLHSHLIKKQKNKIYFIFKNLKIPIKIIKMLFLLLGISTFEGKKNMLKKFKNFSE